MLLPLMHALMRADAPPMIFRWRYPLFEIACADRHIFAEVFQAAADAFPEPPPLRHISPFSFICAATLLLLYFAASRHAACLSFAFIRPPFTPPLIFGHHFTPQFAFAAQPPCLMLLFAFRPLRFRDTVTS